MDDFRIKRKINDSDIDNFKNSQINRILSNTKPKPTYANRKLKLALSFSVLALLILSIGITLLKTKGNNNLNIQQVSAQEYILEFKDSKDYDFFMHYKAHIVYSAQKVSYNDIFDYKQEYIYAPQAVQDTITSTFNYFSIDETKHFLEVLVGGNIVYLELDTFPSVSIHRDLNKLEIDDFKQDLSDIYELIRLYPPIYVGINEHYLNQFEVNPEIDDLDDSKAKRNYIEYINNYYDDSTNHTSNNSSSYVYTFTYNNIILLDEDNNIMDTFAYTTLQGMPTETITDNFSADKITFFEKENDINIFDWTSFISFDDAGLGIMRNGIIDGTRYAYLTFHLMNEELNLNNISYVKLNYSLHQIYGGAEETITINTILYGDYFIIPPFAVIEETDGNIGSLFFNFEIEFYNAEDNLVYSSAVTF